MHAKAVAIAEDTLGPEHPHLATCLMNQAEVLRQQVSHGRARTYPRRFAVRCSIQLNTAKSIAVGVACHGLGMVRVSTLKYVYIVQMEFLCFVCVACLEYVLRC